MPSKRRRTATAERVARPDAVTRRLLRAAPAVVIAASELRRPGAPVADLTALLRPAPEDALTPLAVGPFVNSALHEGPGCAEPLHDSSLFDRPS